MLAFKACLALLLLVTLSPAAMHALTIDDINRASFVGNVCEERNPVAMRLQVMLDRAHFSPGVIDGFMGGNTDKAMQAYAREHDLGAGDTLSEEIWSRLADNDFEPAFVTYSITQEDLENHFVDSIPDASDQLAAMERLSYTGPEEMLSERLHMDIGLLRELNPDADFGRPGSEILDWCQRDLQEPRQEHHKPFRVS